MPTQTSSATTTKVALVVLLVALAFFLIYKFILPKKTSYKPFGGASYIIVPGYLPPGYLPPGYKTPGYK